MRQHQVSAFTLANHPAILKISACAGFLVTSLTACGSVKRFSRHRRRGTPHPAGWRGSSRREDIQQTKLRQFTGRHIAGVEPPRTIFGAPISTFMPCLRELPPLRTWWEIRRSRCQVGGIGNVGVCGVIVAGERNLSRAHRAAMDSRFGCDQRAASANCLLRTAASAHR